MKDVEKSFDIAAGSDRVFDFLLDENFTGLLVEEIDRITGAELTELEERDDGTVRRVCRFTAPTELPGPLKKFAGQAPEEVQWDEIWTIDRQAGRATTEIVADAPDHWHDYYDNEGEVRVESTGDDRSRFSYRLAFELDAPTGMGFFLNRSIKKAIGKVLDGYGAALQREFGS